MDTSHAQYILYDREGDYITVEYHDAGYGEYAKLKRIGLGSNGILRGTFIGLQFNRYEPEQSLIIIEPTGSQQSILLYIGYEITYIA